MLWRAHRFLLITTEFQKYYNYNFSVFKLNKILVISPTYNEAENIQTFIDSVFLIKNLSLLVIDDNSPDGTADTVLSNMKENTNLYLISREHKLGLGTAYIRGI